MRAILLSFAFVLLLPLGAFALTIEDIAGFWVVGVPQTASLNPNVSPENIREMAALTISFDIRARTVTIAYPGDEPSTEAFTVLEETDKSVTIRIGDHSSLRIDREGTADITVGEVYGEERKDVVYFKRVD